MGKLSLTPGVRYDRYESPEYVSAGLTTIVGALAASYEIAPRTQLFAAIRSCLMNNGNLNSVMLIPM